MRWPPISGGKVGWPKGVPRIAKFDDDPLKLNSRASLRTSSSQSILIIANSTIGRSTTRSALERQHQARSNTTRPNSVVVAKTCRARAIKAHPTQRAGSGTAFAQAQRDYFQECVAKGPQKLA
jgi:hypothetical protein